MLENFQGDSWGSIPPLSMPSLLPHDLCHRRSSSLWLLAMIDFQLSYSRSWKMMLWKVLHSACNMHSICNMPAPGTSLSFTVSQSLLKLKCIELMMPSNHLILCHTLLLPSVFPSIRVFSNKSALHIKWLHNGHLQMAKLLKYISVVLHFHGMGGWVQKKKYLKGFSQSRGPSLF